MLNLNNDVLIENIAMLMRDNKITQKELAVILGMSQPNISKALSSKDKKSFTLDQVITLAKRFSVSIDWLVGLHETDNQKTDLRTIASFLADLLISGNAKYTRVNVTEEAYETLEECDDPSQPYREYKRTEVNVTYPAIYFSNYWDIPKRKSIDDPEYEMELATARQGGNISKMKPLNSFLRKFLNIFMLYQKGDIEKDTFEDIVNSYLNELDK